MAKHKVILSVEKVNVTIGGQDQELVRCAIEVRGAKIVATGATIKGAVKSALNEVAQTF